MSPYAHLLLRVMRGGSLAAAVFFVLVIAIELWKASRSGGLGALSRPDIGFLVILVLLLAGALWLARAIARELERHAP